MFSPVFADMIADCKAGMKFRGWKKDSLQKLELVTVTLIGAERTFSLRFPTTEERNHFVIGMGSLVDRMKSGDERLHDAFVRHHRQLNHEIDRTQGPGVQSTGFSANSPSSSQRSPVHYAPVPQSEPNFTRTPTKPVKLEEDLKKATTNKDESSSSGASVVSVKQMMGGQGASI